MPRQTSFSQLVSGKTEVVAAFSVHAPTQRWWRVILWLHSKPTPPNLDSAQARKIVADGFGFYAALYRALAAVFAAITLLLCGAGVFEDSAALQTGLATGLLSAVYLFNASSLGSAGVAALRARKPNAHLALLGFIVMVIAFLSAFVVGAYCLAHSQQVGSPAGNLVVACLLWVFGVGSYLIEVLYLASAPELVALQTNAD